MRNLMSGLALGLALGLLLSSTARELDGGGVPGVELTLAAVLLVGIVAEVLRVRRAGPGERSDASAEV